MPPVYTTTLPIAAPAAKVFSLILDRSTWPTWNDFVPRADVVAANASSSSSASNASASASSASSTIIRAGQTLLFHVQARAFGKLRSVPGGTQLVVTEVTTPDTAPPGGGGGERGTWRVVWESDPGKMPPWFMKAVRVIEVIDDDDGDAGRCVYRTVETWTGGFAWLVDLLTGWCVVKPGLAMWAEGLKKRAEEEGGA